MNSENADLSQSSQCIELARGQTEFMQEILHSYAFRDSGLGKAIPTIEWKISILNPLPEEGHYRESHRELINRGKTVENVYYSSDMINHLEMSILSSDKSAASV